MGFNFKIALAFLKKLLRRYEDDFQIGLFYLILSALRESFGDAVIRRFYVAVSKFVDDNKISV